ncbi:ATP-binding protein [Ramlibacter sp. AN1015]|uniref:ATP-binding protein n=1 Tax=Ramlibacter sp. AN1015 TaxID=3133428 RepID=UPI0030C57BD8
MKTLRERLDRILTRSTLLALTVTGLLLLTFAHTRELRTLRNAVGTQADMVALASVPALSFDDPREAGENLAALRANPKVELAALYDEEGRLFAVYRPNGGPAPPERVPAVGERERLSWRSLVVARTVSVDGERVGTLLLQVQHGLPWAAFEFMLVLAMVMAASLAAALLLSRRLHQQVIQPLRAVSDVAREILSGRMRRLQGPASQDEEVRSLIDAFNAMLDELELRARTLQSANEALRVSEARYQLAVRGSSAGLWDWDVRTGGVFYAPRFKALLGYSEDAFPNTPALVRESLHPEDRSRVMEALRGHLAARQPFQLECRLRHRDVGWRWFLVTGMAERDAGGRAFRMAGSIVDVTERKEAEQVLQDANRAKDEFLATLAHELRNPLAPIRSGLDILKKDSANGPASQRARQTMERQLLHMIRLVDDLLDISRINSGKIHLAMERLRMAEVVETAVELSRPAIAAGAHELVVQLPEHHVELLGDATRLAQALGNLLNNAAKYTPRGGRIEVAMRQEGQDAVIEVRDNGLGIPQPMLDRVFSLFTQVDRRMERAQGGLGIGLYLVRSLIEMHRGTVVAASPGPNQGSTFTVRLPCLAPAGERTDPAAGGGSAPAPAGCRVLVVDDNVDAAETLVTVMEMLGHEARAMHDGEAALAQAADFAPDLVLLDIGLPGLDGYEVARRMRADARLQQAMLVALTGWGSDEDRRRAREAGFDRHLTKPVDVAALEPLLAQVARR